MIALAIVNLSPKVTPNTLTAHPKPTQKEPSMKQPKPEINPSSKTLHAPPTPHNDKNYSLHGQTEPTPGRDQVREDTHTVRSPRESKRPIEKTAKAGKG